MLAGIKVLDFTRVLAGPLSTMLLGDLGADVLKVERRGSGDDTRAWGPPFDARGVAYTYAYIAIKRLGAGQFYLISIRDKDDIVVVSFNQVKILDPAAIRQIGDELKNLTLQAASGRKLLLDFSRVTIVNRARLAGKRREQILELESRQRASARIVTLRHLPQRVCAGKRHD